MKQITHLEIDPELVGEVALLETEHAVVTLTGTEKMAADERGLLHGGFTFGLADYAAMVAVNDPNVVLGGAELKFLRPVKVGDVMRAEALVTQTEGKKRIIKVVVTVKGVTVLSGELTAFVLPKHVLD
ncbi:MAG: thioesterase [Deltaproteobacteria bacterium]|nr:MAG: thioesterase [Deltaproteobacteria bacterium]